MENNNNTNSDVFAKEQDLAKNIANAYKTKRKNEAPEIKEANILEIKEETQVRNKALEIQSRQQNFGGKSDSWFKMTDTDINEKFYWDTQLNKAKTPEERKTASFEKSQSDKKIQASIGSISALEEWKETWLPTKTGRKNVIGGTFSGSTTTDWSKNVYNNERLKNVLLGGAIGNNGELIDEPTYYQQMDEYNQPILMAFVKNKIKPFNVMNVINKDAPQLMNWSNDIKPIVNKMGILDSKSGGFNSEFIDETKTVTTTEQNKNKTKSFKVTKQYLDQKKVNEFKNKLQNTAISVSRGGQQLGEEDYNDVNITYLQYASKMNNEKQFPKKNLDYVGNYRLTPESAGLVEAAFIDWGKKNYVPGYSKDKNNAEVYMTSNTEEIVASSAPEVIGEEVKLLPHQKNKV